jgi:hypothetical protein
MKKILFMTLVVLMTVSLSPGIPFAAATPPVGGTLPDFSLPIPKDPAERNYLGFSGDGLFRAPQIKAKVVVIEVFSLY